MIYTKNGKLLVSPDGKLCSSCCYEFGIDCDDCEPDPFPDGQTPKYFNVTFSGVNLCSGESWPGGIDLNTTWQFTQISACVWKYIDVNWEMLLRLNVADLTSDIYADKAGLSKSYYYAFSLQHCLAEAVDIPNQHTIGDCGEVHCGYGGVASWSF